MRPIKSLFLSVTGQHAFEVYDDLKNFKNVLHNELWNSDKFMWTVQSETMVKWHVIMYQTVVGRDNVAHYIGRYNMSVHGNTKSGYS